MAILWLGFTGLFVAALGIPLAQEFAYSNHQRGLVRDVVGGFLTFLLEVAFFAGFLSLIGYLVADAAGFATFGLVGLIVGFIVAALLSAATTLRR